MKPTLLSLPLAGLLLACAPQIAGATDTNSTNGSPRWSDASPVGETTLTKDAFIGSWSGRFSNGELAFRREWKMRRNADGTFTISFQRYLKGKLVDSGEAKGKWWLADGFYREVIGGEDEVHSYRFIILSPREILFEKPSSGYLFIDRKDPNQAAGPTTPSGRGSS
jgi:hypothetical protein